MKVYKVYSGLETPERDRIVAVDSFKKRVFFAYGSLAGKKVSDVEKEDIKSREDFEETRLSDWTIRGILGRRDAWRLIMKEYIESGDTVAVWDIRL